MNLFPLRIDGPTILVTATTAATSPVQLPYTARAIRITNAGTVGAYVAVRPTSTAATVATGTASQNSTYIGPGADVSWTMQYGTAANYISAITGVATSAALLVQIGEGI